MARTKGPPPQRHPQFRHPDLLRLLRTRAPLLKCTPRAVTKLPPPSLLLRRQQRGATHKFAACRQRWRHQRSHPLHRARR